MDKQTPPINHFRIELADKIYAAMEMEMETRALEEKVLRTMPELSRAPFSWPVPDEYDLLGDIDAIKREKAEVSSNFQHALHDLAAQPNYAELSVSILEGFYGPDDLDSLLKYAKAVVAWMEDNRKHLVELLAHTQVLLREKGDREAKERQERQFLADLLKKSDSLKTYASRTGARLNDLQILVNHPDEGPSSISKQTPSCLDPKYEDHACVMKFQQIYDSLSLCTKRATVIKDGLGEAIAKHQFIRTPLTPTHGIQLDQTLLQSVLEQIVAEELQVLFVSFNRKLFTELDELNWKTDTHLAGTLSDANKLAYH